MPTLVEGIFRTESGNQSDRPLEMEGRLVELDGERDPDLEMLLRRFGTANGTGRMAVGRMKVEWRNRKRSPRTFKVTTLSAAGATTLTSATGYTNVHRDVLMFNTRTKELMIANFDAAVAAAAGFTVASYDNAAGGLKYATAVDDVIQILTEAHAEGENFPEAWASQSEDAYDYIMEIARRGAHISNLADAEDDYNVNPKARGLANKYALIETMEAMNRLMYVSKTTLETTTATARRRAMGGLRQKLTSNLKVMAPGAALTPQIIGELLRLTTFHTSASRNKVFLAGQNAITNMSAWPLQAVRVSPMTKEWGFDVTTVITPYGDLNVVRDKTLSAELGMADTAMILDPNSVKSIYLQGNGMRVIQKVSDLTTSFVIVDGVTTTLGMKVQNEENNAWIEGIN